ncbi:MAG: vanadium-dependent haloperoxidase [Deltaproteobacteria bacterium]|nr:MAG: vanadium-dependent haloperoxidase [Deltaproteobacteria bacterium]
MKTNIRIACSRTQRWWFSGVVLFAAALSVTCSNQSPAQEGRVDKSSTAMQVQWRDRIDETLDWNEHLIDAIFSAGTTPPPALRAAAIMNVAMFDAANGVYRRFHPIHFDKLAPQGTSRRAAVIGAAYTTLSKLFPMQQSKFDADEAASLATLTDDEDDDGSGKSTSLGLSWGTTVANDILAWRATDGFTTVYPPFIGGTALGQWRPTPPAFMPMVQMQFAFMKTFAVASPEQFSPPKPRGLDTAEWVSDYNEVALIASKTGSPRTEDQTAMAFFYAGVGWAHWSEAAHQLAVNNRSSRSDTSRIFAQLAVAGIDTIITTWAAKRAYAADPTALTWRPVTAIQLGGDGNPKTPAKPTWTPLIPTQPHPEYVAAHPSVNGASAALLQRYYGDDDNNQSFTLSYPVAPSTAYAPLPIGSAGTRSLASIAQAEEEANAARLYAGQHYASSIRASDAEGRTISDFVLRSVATRVHDEGGFNSAGWDHNHGDGDCYGDGESATE